jgi:hypothetical protein
MKTVLICAALAVLFAPISLSPASAGQIERECLRSDRDAANRALCACIQQVADMTLRGGDQRRAAAFFRDPDRAHETWMSKRDSDDAFWERYKAFGSTAEAYCAG